ncbi:MAG: murein biosynthesis integral membrane protein MurJ [Solirubrobacteraceae bacterium]
MSPPDPAPTASGEASPGAALPAPGDGPPRQRIARNTTVFAIATGASRIAGLAREVVASGYFGTSGPFSAFTIAFQVPNLLRSLVADAALSAAFVPVFTELLEQGRRKDAFRLATTLFMMILAGLGAITAFFILAAPVIMPLFVGDEFSARLTDLTVGLSQVLFPIVVLLGLNGLVVGILHSYEHFTVPAIAPLVWNVVIIVGLVVLRPAFHGDDKIYAYAIGVLIATVVQLGMSLPMLPRVGFRFAREMNWRDPRLWRVLRLMLPVTLGLGIINFDLVINSALGSLISDQAPRAIDAAFRIYMLPQGVFSVALATVLFPTLSRLVARGDMDGLRGTMGNGLRQICLFLIPAAACTIALATPITRLIYQRGAFGPGSTEIVSEALFWFSFSLPFAGANLLLTRTFFSLQRPWEPTLLALGSLVVNAAVSFALYAPLGVAGPVIGTAVGSIAMTAGQAWALRGRIGRIDGRRTLVAAAQMLLAAVLLGAVAFGCWSALDAALGRALWAQIVSVGLALAAGSAVYAAIVLGLRLPEALQVRALVAGRLGRS